MKMNTPFVYAAFPVLVGALLGAALGYFGQCTSGACPLTSTWWRGAIYGAALGALFAFSSKSANPDRAAQTHLKESQNESVPAERGENSN